MVCGRIHMVFIMQVLSRDSVTVAVDAVIYYRVSNPTMVRMPCCDEGIG